MFGRFILSGGCFVAGLMYGYLTHLGYQVELAQGSIAQRGYHGFKVPHTWIEVDGEPIEIAYNWPDPEDEATQDPLIAYNLKRNSIYLKDEASIIREKHLFMHI